MTAPSFDLTPEVVADFSGGQLDPSDPTLPLRVAGALADLRRYCRWHVFPVRTVTSVLDSAGQAELQLPSLRVPSVDLVELRQWPGEYELLDAEEYRCSQEGQLQRFAPASSFETRPRRFWSWGQEAVRVTYQSGFAPEDCAHLLVALAAAVVRTSGNVAGRASYAVGGRSESYFGGLSTLGVRPLGDELATWDEFRLADEP